MPRKPNRETTGAKAAQPSVTVDPKEGFVVTWQEKDGEGSALRYAVLDPAGLERRRGLVSSGTERFVVPHPVGRGLGIEYIEGHCLGAITL